MACTYGTKQQLGMTAKQPTASAVFEANCYVNFTVQYQELFRYSAFGQ